MSLITVMFRIYEPDNKSYAHVPYPTAIFVSQLALRRMKVLTILSNNETKKPAYLFIFN